MTPLIQFHDLVGLRLEVTRDYGAVRVRLVGEADFADVDRLRAAFDAIDLDGVQRVSLDVTDLGFADAAALHELSSFARRARTTAHDVKTSGARPILGRVARLLGCHADLGILTA
jgi:anti-anti-sigma regulatory factor